VGLSVTGFYKTPEIGYDFATLTGQAFYYFCYGAAVTEVEIDTLTGEWWCKRVDIVHDVGRSINPAIDRGQIEGAYIQGLGWLTMEECIWDSARQAADARPQHLQDPGGQRRARRVQRAPLRRRQRQAHALSQQGRGRAAADAGAVGPSSPCGRGQRRAAGHQVAVELDAPATPERILLACERARGTG
jgi:xanthine dehydrogenase large subunit